MDEKKKIVKFIEKSQAFDGHTKAKLILFAKGTKPATYAQLRVQKNLHDKHKFEELLNANGIVYNVSRAKGYEEIASVGKTVKWKFKGMWYGYDLFHNTTQKRQFEEYIDLIKKQKHTQADKTAGKLYGYPDCCIKDFIAHHDKKKLAKKYTYYSYYKKIEELDKKFPLISYIACSTKCKKTQKLHATYVKTLKKNAPSFYKQYSKKKKYKMPVIIDTQNDPKIWKKNAHNYVLITQKQINKKYYLISWLTKKEYKRGTILDAEITTQYNDATVKIGKEKGKIKNFHHERKFKR